MAKLELPHTSGCVACGPLNRHGLRLSLFVEPETGEVTTEFTPAAEHIGFEGIVHGGILSVVLDEAMVWAATWSARRFCLCGELSLRFSSPALVGMPLAISARVERARARLIQTVAEVRSSEGVLVASGSAKYVPLPAERSREVVATLLDTPSTRAAAEALRRDAGEPVNASPSNASSSEVPAPHPPTSSGNNARGTHAQRD